MLTPATFPATSRPSSVISPRRSGIFNAPPDGPREPSSMTSEADRIVLLALARTTIAAHIDGTVASAPDLVGVLARLGGAFVTLHARGDLRGCVGHIETTE